MAIQLLTAFLGSMGFSILFHIRGVKLLFAGLGGFLSWGFYLLISPAMDSLLIANLLAASFSAAYAEVMARALRSPATIFVIPSLIPLVPGGALYYAMYSAMVGDSEALSFYGFQTWNVALGIAIGVAAVTSICNLLTVLRRRHTAS